LCFEMCETIAGGFTIMAKASDPNQKPHR